MRSLGLSLLVGCGAAPVPDDACAPPTPLPDEGGIDPELAARLTTAVRDARARIAAPGVAVGVTVPGQGTLVVADGFDAVREGTPFTDDLAGGIGSITKTFVTALTLQLADEGALSLDDPIAPWFDGVIPEAEAITIGMLLRHGSGLHTYTDIPAFYAALADQDGAEIDVDTIIALSAAEGLDFPPGTSWAYSNTNYFVVGRILEAVTEQPLPALLRTRLLEPVGLTRTWLMGFEDPPPCVRLATGHVGNDPSFVIHPAWQWASGGLAADVRDLLRWSLALFDGDAVTDAQRAVMTTPAPYTTPDGDPAPYGTGLRLETTTCGPVVGHTGSTLGYQSDLFRTADGVHVVALQNDFLPEVSDVAEAVCGVIGSAPQ